MVGIVSGPEERTTWNTYKTEQHGRRAIGSSLRRIRTKSRRWNHLPAVLQQSHRHTHTHTTHTHTHTRPWLHARETQGACSAPVSLKAFLAPSPSQTTTPECGVKSHGLRKNDLQLLQLLLLGGGATLPRTCLAHPHGLQASVLCRVFGRVLCKTSSEKGEN